MYPRTRVVEEFARPSRRGYTAALALMDSEGAMRGMMRQMHLARVGIWIACACALTGCAVTSSPLVSFDMPVVNGRLGCGNLPYTLDRAINAQDSAYFRQWGQSDYDAARKVVTVCASEYSAKVTRERLAALGQLDRQYKKIIAAVERANRRWNLCTSTAAYQRYLALKTVHSSLRSERYWKRLLRREQRVGRISGVVNMETEHEAGVEIVQSQDAIVRAWRVYLHNGGNGHNLAAARQDPCHYTVRSIPLIPRGSPRLAAAPATR